MTELALCILSAVLFAAAVLLFLRAKRTQDQLDALIASAMRGDFRAAHYDESRLSRTEQQLAHYLSANALTRSALDENRARIQGLIGDISHQTRTPIANILLYTSLLDEEPLTSEQHALAAQAREQAEKLQFLIDMLVKTSHLETGLVQVHPATGPLAPMLDRLRETYRPAAQAKGITLTVCPTDIQARFDRKWTAEAVGNLIDNAIKYTPPGGTVTVSAQQAALFCAVSVRDTGPGIPESEHAKVFSRFYRSPSVSQLPGVGIGLYLAREIVRAEGGYIKLSSAAGRGATFSVFLPKE